MNRTIRQAGWRWVRRRCCARRRWRPPRRPRIFSPLCSARSAARPHAAAFDAAAVCQRRRSARRRAESRRARGLFRRRAGLLRAHLRRALFPDLGLRQSKPGGVLQQFLPGQRNQGGLWRQYRQCRRPRAGKPYSELPNAFRYRNEIVAGCTCNGKDQFGLAPVKIENDPTLAQGRHRRRRQRADGRRPRRRQARRVAEFLAGAGIGAARAISACRWWRRSNGISSVMAGRSASASSR